MGLKYHMEDALIEQGMEIKSATHTPCYAIFSKKYVNDISNLDHTKKHDYCFIGAIGTSPKERKWVVDFAKSYFTKDSVFINTDTRIPWTPLGDFDYTNINIGFCPSLQPNSQSRSAQYRDIKDNLFYFQTMCQSKYVLCPAGDSPWSFRFYETLMCESIPVVNSYHHTYRTREESTIPYKYVLIDNLKKEEMTIAYDEYIRENTNLFKKYHMIAASPSYSPDQIITPVRTDTLIGLTDLRPSFSTHP